MNRRFSARTKSKINVLHNKVKYPNNATSTLFSRQRHPRISLLSSSSVEQSLRPQRSCRAQVKTSDSFSYGSTPHSSPKNEVILPHDNFNKNLSRASYDDCYQMDDSVIEKIMEDQGAIMTANSVSPASPILMPPGPPTSPVPSPSVSHIDHEDLLVRSTFSNYNLKCTSKSSIRLRKRKRRNAICESNQLGKGLREFLVSYVVSNLSDSMTNSLNLEAENLIPMRKNHFSSSDDVASTSTDFENTVNIDCPEEYSE